MITHKKLLQSPKAGTRTGKTYAKIMEPKSLFLALLTCSIPVFLSLFTGNVLTF